MPDRAMKPSRLLARLDAEIAGARTQVAADCKQAERAGYLARMGRIDDAKAVVAALHQRYDQRPHIEVSVWTHLVEGLIGHFSDMDTGARQKIQRAHALSMAAGLKPLQALSAAWLAHMEYLRVNVDLMKISVDHALLIAERDHHSALARTSLVIALALHCGGRSELARPWYAHARNHAALEGDDLTISALMHNMAWLRAHDMRCSLLEGHCAAEDSQHALLSAESLAHFDALIGSVSLKALTPILTAQILAYRGRAAEALQLYEANLAESLAQGMTRLQADLLADQAWCRLQLGQVEAAMRDAVAAAESKDSKAHFDDQALAHGRLALLFKEFGNEDAANFHGEQAELAWAGHRAFRAKLLDAFGAVCYPRNLAGSNEARLTKK